MRQNIHVVTGKSCRRPRLRSINLAASQRRAASSGPATVLYSVQPCPRETSDALLYGLWNRDLTGFPTTKRPHLTASSSQEHPPASHYCAVPSRYATQIAESFFAIGCRWRRWSTLWKASSNSGTVYAPEPSPRVP